MDPRTTPITALADGVAAGRPHQVEAAVRAAYAAGIGRDALVIAVDMVRRSMAVPLLLIVHAYVLIYEWDPTPRRRPTPPPHLAPRGA